MSDFINTGKATSPNWCVNAVFIIWHKGVIIINLGGGQTSRGFVLIVRNNIVPVFLNIISAACNNVKPFSYWAQLNISAEFANLWPQVVEIAALKGHHKEKGENVPQVHWYSECLRHSYRECLTIEKLQNQKNDSFFQLGRRSVDQQWDKQKCCCFHCDSLPHWGFFLKIDFILVWFPVLEAFTPPGCYFLNLTSPPSRGCQKPHFLCYLAVFFFSVSGLISFFSCCWICET